MRYTIFFAVLWTAVPAFGQGEMTPGYFRGTLVTWQGTALSGRISARNSADAVYECQYDSRSYFERDHERLPVAKLAPGDPVEILADHKPGSRACYARIIHVVTPMDGAKPSVVPVRASFRPATSRGDRSVAGLVTALIAGKLTLKTRSGEEILQLRPDTKYLDNGLAAEAAQLAVNTRVFVKAGTSREGIVEAFQVVWGNILNFP